MNKKETSQLKVFKESYFNDNNSNCFKIFYITSMQVRLKVIAFLNANKDINLINDLLSSLT